MTQIYQELFSKCFVEISLLYSQEQYSRCNIDLRFSPQSPHVVRLLPILIYSRGMSILDHDEIRLNVQSHMLGLSGGGGGGG